MGKAERTWIEIGETDPYFGVLTDDRFSRGNIAAHLDSFTETGREYVTALMAEISEHHAFSRFGRALDFGCGVGRLTIPLASHFDEAVGLDISPAMLDEARKMAGTRQNVTFALSDDSLGNAPGEFDLVHSYIVLQHIPVHQGMQIVRHLLRKVSVGGIAALHFPVARDGGTLGKLRYWARCNIPGVQPLSNLLRGRPLSEPMMQMNAYPLPAIYALLEEFRFERSVAKLERHFNVLKIRIIAQKGERPIWSA